jgi:hypothetical protein
LLDRLHAECSIATPHRPARLSVLMVTLNNVMYFALKSNPRERQFLYWRLGGAIGDQPELRSG